MLNYWFIIIIIITLLHLIKNLSIIIIIIIYVLENKLQLLNHDIYTFCFSLSFFGSKNGSFMLFICVILLELLYLVIKNQN
jgi:hypothetical protein